VGTAILTGSFVATPMNLQIHSGPYEIKLQLNFHSDLESKVAQGFLTGQEKSEKKYSSMKLNS
jgi:hypothetical protein